MNINFVLNEDYLAFFILKKKMFNESLELENYKLSINSDLGYKKILEKEYLDSSIYLKDNNIKKLVYEFISTSKFEQIYKLYINKSKESIAIAVLNGTINIKDEELSRIKNDLWIKNIEGYRALLNMNSFNVSIFLLDQDVKKTIDDLKNTEEFKKLYKETKMYLENIKKDWEQNMYKINDYLKTTLKINFNKNITAYITHPNTCEGYSFDNDKVVWGHFRGINNSNYNLVYLTHEWLHSVLPFTEEDDEIDCYIKHAIIELISDYELYSKLEGNSTLKEGHSFLNDYKVFLYPYWLKYIGLNNDMIKERMKKDSVNYDEIVMKNLSNMNIEEFIKFCSNKYVSMINVKEQRNK